MRVRTLILSAIVAFSTSGCLIEDFDDGVIDEPAGSASSKGAVRAWRKPMVSCA